MRVVRKTAMEQTLRFDYDDQIGNEWADGITLHEGVMKRLGWYLRTTKDVGDAKEVTFARL